MVVKAVPKVCYNKTRGKGSCYLVHQVVRGQEARQDVGDVGGREGPSA